MEPHLASQIYYSEAETMSMESALPSTTVYICDFHREQCWERWVKDHKHGLTETEGTELLDLRDCALAPPSHSTDQTEDSLYHLAVGRAPKGFTSLAAE